MRTTRNDERVALEEVFNAIARTPEQNKLHNAVTDIHDIKAIDDLRDLVHGDFARLNLQSEVADNFVYAPGVDQSNDNEVLTEQLLCLKNLEADFRRGIVVIEERAGSNAYSAEFEKDKIAGTDWETIKARLLMDDGELLQKATGMPGGAELIGVYPNGELYMISRNNNEEGHREPVIIAYDLSDQGHLAITTDSPNREAILKNISNGEARLGNYWEIRKAVIDSGYMLPPDSPDYVKEGLVAATEVVTGKPFIRSINGKECINAILECGDVACYESVRVVSFIPSYQFTDIDDTGAMCRFPNFGAVYVLRG